MSKRNYILLIAENKLINIRTECKLNSNKKLSGKTKSPPFSTSKGGDFFQELMYHIHHIEEREHDRHDDNSDQSPDSDDDNWLDHTRNPLDSDIHILVVPDCHLFEHVGERSCLFADFHRHRKLDREAIDPSLEIHFVASDSFSSDLSLDILPSECCRKRLPDLDVGQYSIDFPLVVAIVHTCTDDRKRAIYENSGIEKRCEKLSKHDEDFLAEDTSEDGQ